MTQTLATIVAFAAFGANLLGGALLLLFNPRHPAIRWHMPFTIALLGWLLLQGLLVANELPHVWWRAYGMVVHFLPALFFSATLVRLYPGRPRWQALLPPAAAVLVLLLLGDPLQSRYTMIWQAVAWGTPALLYFKARSGRPEPRARRLHQALGFVVPFGVIGAIALEGGFILFALPLVTIAIQLLVFTGIVHHGFYDIEVRAARTGELAAAAAEQDRLTLLGELSATIAHEVRNPLTGIRSLTQMIAEAPLDDDERRRYTDVILAEIARLDRIVGNLTDLARRSASNGQAGEPSRTSVSTLFEDLGLLVQARARRVGVSIVTDAGDVADVDVAAPRDALAQALLNLLLNAIAHAPAGSAVRLLAAHEAGRFIIAVQDAGPGVPAERRARIFEPFETSGGTGLGLAVVRRLADQHGWQLEVHDAPGGGAEFRLAMAVAVAAAGEGGG